MSVLFGFIKLMMLVALGIAAWLAAMFLIIVVVFAPGFFGTWGLAVWFVVFCMFLFASIRTEQREDQP